MASRAHIEYERNARRRVAEYDEQKAKRLALSGSLENHGMRVYNEEAQNWMADRSRPVPAIPPAYARGLNIQQGVPFTGDLPIARVNPGGKEGPVFPAPPRRDYEDIANLRRNWMTAWPWLRNLPADVREAIAYRAFGEDEERLWGITDREYGMYFGDPEADASLKMWKGGDGRWKVSIPYPDYPNKAFGVSNAVKGTGRALASESFAGTEGGQIALFPPRNTPRFVSPVEKYLYGTNVQWAPPFQPPEAPLYPAPFEPRPAPQNPGGIMGLWKRLRSN